jgi:hypothetical protein
MRPPVKWRLASWRTKSLRAVPGKWRRFAAEPATIAWIDRRPLGAEEAVRLRGCRGPQSPKSTRLTFMVEVV